MEFGRNTFTVEYESGKVKEFEKKILSMGVCRAFLPVSFLQMEGVDKVTYDCSGYRPIEECEFKNSYEMLTMLEKTLLKMIDCCEHLINPKRIEVNEKTVFWSSGKKEVKLTYALREFPSQNLSSGILALVEQLDKKDMSGEMRRNLKAVEEYAAHSNGSLFDVINCIGELKQEIYQCGWDCNEKSRV